MLAGYVVGLALVIIVGQIPALLGLPGGSGSFFQLAWHVLREVSSLSGWLVGIGLASLALILALRALAPRLPGSLSAVVAGIVAARALDLDTHGVAELGKVSAELPYVSLPNVTFADVERLFAGAAGLSLLALRRIDRGSPLVCRQAPLRAGRQTRS